MSKHSWGRREKAGKKFAVNQPVIYSYQNEEKWNFAFCNSRVAKSFFYFFVFLLLNKYVCTGKQWVFPGFVAGIRSHSRTHQRIYTWFESLINKIIEIIIYIQASQLMLPAQHQHINKNSNQKKIRREAPSFLIQFHLSLSLLLLISCRLNIFLMRCIFYCVTLSGTFFPSIYYLRQHTFSFSSPHMCIRQYFVVTYTSFFALSLRIRYCTYDIWIHENKYKTMVSLCWFSSYCGENVKIPHFHFYSHAFTCLQNTLALFVALITRTAPEQQKYLFSIIWSEYVWDVSIVTYIHCVSQIHLKMPTHNAKAWWRVWGCCSRKWKKWVSTFLVRTIHSGINISR